VLPGRNYFYKNLLFVSCTVKTVEEGQRMIVEEGNFVGVGEIRKVGGRKREKGGMGAVGDKTK